MPGGFDRYSTGIADAAELDPLMPRGQKAAAPQPVVQRLIVGAAGAARDHRHERRQVLVLAPQAVRNPGPDARPAGQLRAGVDERDGRVVVDRLGVHAT